MGLIIVLLGFLLFSLIVVQLSSKTFVLGVFLLFFCFLLFLVFCFLNMLWYGLLFFLVYVGGVLVLFFYIFSLNPNPNISSIFIGILRKNVFFSVLGCFFIFYFFSFFEVSDYFLNSFFEDKSYFLFNGLEAYFIFFLGLALVFILFVVRYLTRSLNGALRSFSSL